MGAVRGRWASAHIVTAWRADAPLASTWAGRSCWPARSTRASQSITAPSARSPGLDQSARARCRRRSGRGGPRAAAGGEIAAVGFGIPCLIDQRTGRGVMAVNLPLADIPFGAIMAERLGLPVFVDNDANVAALAEHRAGAARGAQRGGDADDRHRDRRRADPARRALPRRDRRGGRARPHGDRQGRAAAARATARTTAASRRSRRARRSAREALRVARERPDSGLGRALAEGRELAGPLVTELAHDGDEAAIEVLAHDRPQPRRRRSRAS